MLGSLLQSIGFPEKSRFLSLPSSPSGETLPWAQMECLQHLPIPLALSMGYPVQPPRGLRQEEHPGVYIGEDLPTGSSRRAIAESHQYTEIKEMESDGNKEEAVQ